MAVHESTCKVVSRVYIYEMKTYLGLSLSFATGGGIGGGRRRHSCGGLWSGCLRAASEQMSVHCPRRLQQLGAMVVEVAGGIVSGSQMVISKVYIYEIIIYLGLVVCDSSSSTGLLR